MAFVWREIMIGFDSSKIFVKLEKGNSFFVFNIDSHRCRQICLYQEPNSDLVNHVIELLNLVHFQTDAVGTGMGGCIWMFSIWWFYVVKIFLKLLMLLFFLCSLILWASCQCWFWLGRSCKWRCKIKVLISQNMSLPITWHFAEYYNAQLSVLQTWDKIAPCIYL